jgi:hypothetical protein
MDFIITHWNLKYVEIQKFPNYDQSRLESGHSTQFPQTPIQNRSDGNPDPHKIFAGQGMAMK